MRRRSYVCPKRFTSRVAVAVVFIVLVVWLNNPGTSKLNEVTRKPSIITSSELASTTPPPPCLQIGEHCSFMVEDSVQSLTSPPDMLIIQELGILGEIVTNQDYFGTLQRIVAE